MNSLPLEGLSARKRPQRGLFSESRAKPMGKGDRLRWMRCDQYQFREDNQGYVYI